MFAHVFVFVYFIHPSFSLSLSISVYACLCLLRLYLQVCVLCSLFLFFFSLASSQSPLATSPPTATLPGRNSTPRTRVEKTGVQKKKRGDKGEVGGGELALHSSPAMRLIRLSYAAIHRRHTHVALTSNSPRYFVGPSNCLGHQSVAVSACYISLS